MQEDLTTRRQRMGKKFDFEIVFGTGLIMGAILVGLLCVGHYYLVLN